MNKYFREWQLGPEYFYANAAERHHRELDWFDRQITAAKSRRDATIRELDRHREAMRRLEHRPANTIDNATFDVISDRRKASH